MVLFSHGIDALITALFAALMLVLIATYAVGAESTAQHDAPTARFYTPDGRSAGTASTYGNTTRFYAPNGQLTGTVTHNGRK